MLTDQPARLNEYPYALISELRECANEHGYRIGPDQAKGWLFFRSASAPGEIGLAATAAGMAGPFYLSVFHPGAARELAAPEASDKARDAAKAFVLESRTALRQAVADVYRLSISLPTLPLESYLRDIEGLGDTEAERAQKVRIGQNRFREAQLSYWNCCCPLTGIIEPDLLRASHIIPWAKCDSDAERLDVHNGFLLSSLWDAAFDSGLVTFDDDGLALVSPTLSSSALAALGLHQERRLSLHDAHRARLAWHREHLFQSD